MEKLLELLDINLDGPSGYFKIFIAACVCGFIAAFAKDIFMV